MSRHRFATAALVVTGLLAPALLGAQSPVRLYSTQLPGSFTQPFKGRWSGPIPGASLDIPASAAPTFVVTLATAIDLNGEHAHPAANLGAAVRIVETTTHTTVAAEPFLFQRVEMNGEQFLMPLTLQGTFQRTNPSGPPPRFAVELWTSVGTVATLFLSALGPLPQSEIGPGTLTALAF
jgi:hypothetical protein